MTSHKSIMVWGDYGPDSITGQWSANTYDRNDAVEYVPSALDAAPQAVAVKPLVWVPTKAIRKHLVEGETVIEMATKGNFLYTLVKNYQIGMSWSAYQGRNRPIPNGTCVSLEAAKAAAQADYADRILSCIDAAPSPLSAAMAYERAAMAGYAVCAETRHVSLGHKVKDTIRALSAEIPAADLDAAAVEQLLDADDAGRICLSVATYHALQDLKGSQP